MSPEMGTTLIAVGAESTNPLARSEEALRRRRTDLYDQFEELASAADQLDLQLALAEEIRLAEVAVKRLARIAVDTTIMHGTNRRAVTGEIRLGICSKCSTARRWVERDRRLRGGVAVSLTEDWRP